MNFETACGYCLSEIGNAFTCTNTCLSEAGIAPVFPITTFIISILFSIALFMASIHFKNDLKKFIVLRILSIAFATTGMLVIGLIFNGHKILRNIPYLIPFIGIASYLVSHFFSFYILKASYRAKQLGKKQKTLEKLCKLIGINIPKVYVIFNQQLKAFSVDGFKKAIFLSDKLLEKLSEKELEAVILHELYHLKRKSGSLKNFLISLSRLNFRIIPAPINALELYEEEEVDKILLEKHGIDMRAIKWKL